MAKIAGMDATSNRACAIGAARMVGVVDKVGGTKEMDVMAHLGDLDTIIVCLNHQKPWFLVIEFSLFHYISTLGT